MRKLETFDVAIVGAGLAGLKTAQQLSQQNLRVFLADQKAEAHGGVASTGIFVRRTVEDFPEVTSHLSAPISTIYVHSPKGRRLRINSPHPEFRIADMGNLFSSLASDAITHGCEWGAEHKLVYIEPLGPYSALRFATPHGARHIRARYVVGADGARSRVAANLGLSRNKKLIRATEEVFAGGGDLEKAYHCFIDPELAPGYLGWLAVDGAQVHIGVGGAGNAFDAEAALQKLKSRLEKVLGLSRLQSQGRRGGLIPVGGFLKQVANRRGLLAGNAAGAVSPLTAGGHDGGLRLASEAAQLIPNLLNVKSGDSYPLTQHYGKHLVDTRLVSHRLVRELYEMFSNPNLVEAAFATAGRGPLYAIAKHVFFGRDGFADSEYEWSMEPAWKA